MKRTIGLIWLFAVLLVLVACGTLAPVQEQPETPADAPEEILQELLTRD